jgi:hypothetical protein
MDSLDRDDRQASASASSGSMAADAARGLM